MHAFDNEKYLSEQMEEFDKRMNANGFSHTLIEFGGKGWGDYHASRVLPGYDPDIKGMILQGLAKSSEIVMVLNTMDILYSPDGRTVQGRIRGDTGLKYQQEVLRKIAEGNDRFGLGIKRMILSCYPSEEPSYTNKKIIDQLYQESVNQGIQILKTSQINNYPKCSIQQLTDGLKDNPYLSKGSKNLVFISPGGGSGKFGVVLSEINHALRHNLNPNFVKFETFPVFSKPVDHPLNVAFEAATADLGNKVKDTIYGTNYDKDIENHQLLMMIYAVYGEGVPQEWSNSPIQFGVNRIQTGIVDDDAVKQACYAEIQRRLERYDNEIKIGMGGESALMRVKDIIRNIKYIQPLQNYSKITRKSHGH